MIETPQHLIPTEPVRARVLVEAARAVGNFPLPALPEAHGKEVAVGEGSIPSGYNIVAIIITAILVIIVIVIILIIAGLTSRRKPLPRAVRPPSTPAAVGGGFGLAYVYEGLRGELRRIYLRALDALRRAGVFVPQGYAPLEVARAAAGRGLRAIERIAVIYRETMYRREGPREGDVSEARRLVGEL